MKRKIFFVFLLLIVTPLLVSSETDLIGEVTTIQQYNSYMDIEITRYNEIDKNGQTKTMVTYYKELDYLVVRVYQLNSIAYDECKFENLYFITLQDWLRKRDAESRYYHYTTQKRTLWYNKMIDGKPYIVFDVHIVLSRD